MKNNNKKIVLSLVVLTAVISNVFFSISDNLLSEKPSMAKEFQPILKLNDAVYQQASLSNDSVEEFSKPLPVSLEGIDLNIELPVDSDGNLIIGMILKDFFEIYLSVMGEEELEDILLRIQSAMNQQLISPALEQGYEALKRFIDYKVELANLEQQEVNPDLSELDNIRHQKEILAAIQQDYFSPAEADAFFAAEAQYDAFMLEHLTIQQNENLTLEEKQAQTQALAESLPDEIKQGREAAMAPANVYEQAINMKSNGASNEAIYQMRSETLGDEAAQALAQLDNEREIWNQRLESFQAQYQAIQSSGMSDHDADVEINALLGRDFTATEAIRVKAISGL
jgi:lipase chaperone LimK